MGMPKALNALNPFGPIFGKELRVTARRKRTYFLRFFYLLALLLVLLAVYTSTSYRESYAMSVAERAQQEAELGNLFFIAFSLFSIYALPTISPILTATAVSAERLGKTLPVLLMTPITSWQIISGKLFSRLLAAMTLIGLSLPVLAVVRLLGGVELGQMLSVLALCIVASLTAAAIGLFYSTFMNRAYAVILLSYATMLFIYGFVPFIFSLMFISNLRDQASLKFLYSVLLCINPFLNVFGMVLPRGIGFGTQITACLTIHLCFTGILVFWAAAVLRRQARRQGESAATIAPQDYIPFANTVVPSTYAESEIASASPPPLPYAAVNLPLTKEVKQRSVSDNPVLWREIRRPLMARPWQAKLGGILSIILLLITYLAIASTNGNGLSVPEVQIGYAFVFCGLYTLLVCVLSASMIAGEKESDTWILLLATPISARAIVWGKIAGTVRRLMWPSLLIFGHFLIFTIFQAISLSTLLMICWIILTFNALWLATGLYFSLRFRTVTFAVISNLLMPFIVYGAVPLILFILSNVIHSRSSDLPSYVGYYLPYFYLGEGISGLEHHRDTLYDYPYYLFNLPTGSHSVTRGGFLIIVFYVGLAYLLLSACTIAYISRRFDRIVGRAPQINS